MNTAMITWFVSVQLTNSMAMERGIEPKMKKRRRSFPRLAEVNVRGYQHSNNNDKSFCEFFVVCRYCGSTVSNSTFISFFFSKTCPSCPYLHGFNFFVTFFAYANHCYLRTTCFKKYFFHRHPSIH